MGLLSREFTDATVISIGHRPELAAFHQRKIVLERSRKGAKLVDGAASGHAFLRECEAARTSLPIPLSKIPLIDPVPGGRDGTGTR